MPVLRASLAVLALATTLPLATVPTASAAPAMVVAELPGLPGFAAHYVTGINDLGQVVGTAHGDGTAHAVLWSPRGGPTDLGPGLAGAVNQRGQVLGSDIRYAGPNVHKPWIWSGGVRTTIAPAGAAWAMAQVINERGAVPMTYSTSSLSQQPQYAAVWEGGRHTALPVSGPDGWLYAINDAGVVAGSNVSASGTEFAAIRCAEGTCTKLAPGPGYGTYGPEAINEAGVIVGNRGTVALRWEGDDVTVLSENGRVSHGEQSLNERGDAVGWSADATGSRRAVLWPAGRKPVDLGVPAPSEAVAVNERGDIVGMAWAEDYSTTRTFLWRAGRVTYLDSLGGTFTVPVALNNHGIIIGAGTTIDGTEKPVRWTPSTTTPLR